MMSRAVLPDRLTEALAEASTVEEVAGAIFAEGISALGARSAVLLVARGGASSSADPEMVFGDRGAVDLDWLRDRMRVHADVEPGDRVALVMSPRRGGAPFAVLGLAYDAPLDEVRVVPLRAHT